MNDDIFATRYPPGHYYSPLPSAEYVAANRDRIFSPPSLSLQGIDLRGEHQLASLRDLLMDADKLPNYGQSKVGGLRFHLNQLFFVHKDAALYFLMILRLAPQRIIEVGCGHSSHIALDANELYFENFIACSFIEPHPQRFFAELKPEDQCRVNIHAECVQRVGVDIFKALRENDVLFIDSSHVAKIGSDVNYLLFEVLPVLASGVYIHIHDIFYPFEYPEHWIDEGRAWNEAYMLRAFLQYNQSFEIVLFNHYLQLFWPEEFNVHPMLQIGDCGSLWLRRR